MDGEAERLVADYDYPALAACLREIARQLDLPDTDLGWGALPDETVEDLRREIGSLLARVAAGCLTDREAHQLMMLFAPTGTLQETSMASGWANEYLALSARFDSAVRQR